MPRNLIGILAITCGFAAAATAGETNKTAALCDSAAWVAADEVGIPVDVLLAITRTETGRSGPNGFHPWPWTVNMEGAGHWFANRHESEEYALNSYQNGARSFDVGCFQINYRWHSAGFGSIKDMFDPLENARYAARFLKKLYQEFGDWSAAAGAFHSRTPKYSQSYAARFDKIRKNVNPDISKARFVSATLGLFDRRGGLSAANSSKPLIAGVLPGLGSLVPVSSAHNAPGRAILPSNRGG